jgi:hypothetical protein
VAVAACTLLNSPASQRYGAGDEPASVAVDDFNANGSRIAAHRAHFLEPHFLTQVRLRTSLAFDIMTYII